MYKVFLFDFGGVILEHPKAVIPVVLARVYNQPIEITAKAYAKYKNAYLTGQLSTAQIITALSSRFKSHKSVKEIKKLWLQYYGELAKPNKNILDIIKKLRLNYKVYLFSNTTEVSNVRNSQTGIYDYFDDLFLSYRMGMKKPNKNIYENVIASLRVNPQECIFIDDDKENLETARNMDMKVILFNILTDQPVKLIEELKQIGVII